MIKNNVFMKHFKRVFSALLAVVVMVTLSGCAESSDKKPTGGLESSTVYASNGKYSLTIGDLYEELRHNSLGFLNQRIEEVTFEDYLDKVDRTNPEHEELVAEYIFKEIHGTYDQDEINDLSAYTKELAISKYIDTMYLEGYTVVYSHLNCSETSVLISTDSFNVLWEEYSIDVATYLYAFDVLTEEIEEHNADAEKDDDLDVYFTDEEIAFYFDNNYAYEGDVDALIIRFVNQNEADSVYKKFGLKSFNGELYLIQPPKDEFGMIDYDKWDNESSYNKYYDEYSISQSDPITSDAPISALGNDATILKMFIEMYNYIYTYRNTLSYDSRSTSISHPSTGLTITNSHHLYYYTLMLNILEGDRNGNTNQTFEDLSGDLITNHSNNITFTKEKLDNYASSLTSYVHDTLRTTPEQDDDGNDLDFIQYTASSRSYNNNYYLIYKLTDAPETDFYETDEDEDGNTIYTFDETILASELNVENSTLSLYDQILEDMFYDELTDAYISNKASSRGENIKVEIFDSILELNYSLANEGYTGTKGFEDNLIARITFDDGDLEWTTEITVVEAYTFLESIYGAQTSTYLLFDKYVTDSSYYFDVTSEEDYYQTYKDNVYITLNNFANDAYSSYGYPATIGKYNFMKSFYRTANVDEAIEYLTLQEAKRQFFLDLDDDFYSEMFGFTNQAYTNFYSLTLNTINVYVDMDEDGIPDSDWFNTDDDGYASSSSEYVMSSEEKKQLALELIGDIIKYVKKSTESLTMSFDSVVAEYNNSTRIVPSSSDNTLNGSIEAKWAKYRKHGLYISTNSLGEFSNSTAGLDKKMQELVEGIYTSEAKEVIFNNSFSGSYLVEDEFILNDDGYNLMLITDGTGKTEIDYKNEDSDLYKNVPIKIGDTYKIYEDLSSDGVQANLIQVEVYCREYFATGGSVSLSSYATGYLDTYLTPALTKFNSEVVQLMIMRNVLGVIESTQNENFVNGVNNYILYLQRVSDEYYNTTTTHYTSYNFEGFWTYIEKLGGNN